MALGPLNGTVAASAQSLGVATNVPYGFTVFIRSTGPFSSPSGSIADVPFLNIAPGPFPLSGEAFGYTTNDLSLNTASPTRFFDNGAMWSALTTTNAEVATGTAGNNEQCVAIQARAGSTTKAGNYKTTVVYSVTPTF